MNDAVAKIKQDNEAMLKSELKAVVETVNKIKQDHKLMLQEEFKNNLIENNSKMVDDLKTKIESVDSKTYADVAKNLLKIPHSQSFPIDEFVLLLKPLAKGKSDYHSNKNLITRALTSKGNVLKITSIGGVFGGSVKIITSNETNFTAIKVLLESMQDITEAFEITRPQKRKPQVIVYNIDKKELLEGLLQKNCFLHDANNVPLVKVEFPIQARNKESRHWVVTIDPSIFKELWLKQFLYFNWSRVRFTEFIGIRQRRTCGVFGHTAKYCDDRDKPPI
ncbi:hypothetical protein AVEN_234459-1 [Araneus ventricosus]|uniref:Uncharacterized protein n=1 Tax=Araneus ventricosus TaxID=182803 RepID=A0A4Y2A908_ARAVE|nr:hypothetical protein AVEN_234459-1 [Araneus ventricosus]